MRATGVLTGACNEHVRPKHTRLYKNTITEYVHHCDSNRWVVREKACEWPLARGCSTGSRRWAHQHLCLARFTTWRSPRTMSQQQARDADNSNLSYLGLDTVAVSCMVSRSAKNGIIYVISMSVNHSCKLACFFKCATTKRIVPLLGALAPCLWQSQLMHSQYASMGIHTDVLNACVAMGDHSMQTHLDDCGGGRVFVSTMCTSPRKQRGGQQAEYVHKCSER